MSDIVWNLVNTTTKLFTGCGGGGICCMGNKELLAYYEEVGSASAGFNAQRLLRSIDNGLTWVELSPYLESTAFSGLSDWFPGPGRLLSLGTGIVLVGSADVTSTNAAGAIKFGYLQPNGVTPAAGAAPITKDRGATWTNAALNITGTVLDGSGASDVGFQGFGMLQVSATEIWICGFINDFNSLTIPNVGYIKTTDGGTTWTLGSIIDTDMKLTGAGDFICDGISLGNNRIVMGATHHNPAPAASSVLTVSTDKGATWATKTLPIASNKSIITCQKIIQLSDNSLLACGTLFGSPNTTALWKSTDLGDTWTDIAANLTAVATLGRGAQDILALGGLRAVVVVNGSPAAGHKFFYLTADGGTTWTVCTMNGSSAGGASTTGQQFAIAEDGSILCTINGGSAGTQPMEIWRGTVSGFTAPTSPCATLAAGPCTDIHGHFLASFTFTPSSLDFGTVPLGSSSTLPLQVCNVGLATGTTPIVPDDPQLTVDQPLVTLAPGTCTTVNVTFTPTAAGPI